LLITLIFLSILRPPLRHTLFPYTTLFRSPVATREKTAGACPTTQTPRRKTVPGGRRIAAPRPAMWWRFVGIVASIQLRFGQYHRSEEHTSELQSHLNLVCRLLLEKKKNKI